MKRRLNDATPEEHDAVNYYKKLDERLPDDFWFGDGEPDPSVVKDDNWDEDRVDTIGQNGNDGLHYGQITANNTATDNVSKPKHYQILDKEVIDYIYNSLSAEEFRGYCVGNIMKYRLRAGKKGDALEDLAKANEYEKIWERYYSAY